MRSSIFSGFAAVAGFSKFINAATIPVAAKCSCGSSSVTTTVPWTGTAATTSTVLPCSASSGTVIIKTPSTSGPGVVTATTPWTGTFTSTTTVPLSGTNPGTVIIETPTPAPSACLVKPQCSASGLNIDYYANPLDGYSSGKLSSSYYLAEGLKALESSSTNVVGFPENQSPNLPPTFPDPNNPTSAYHVGWARSTNGGISVDANNFTLVYSGFYLAPTTGTYQICSAADNENDVFFGASNAFNCCNGQADPAAAPLFKATGGNFINPTSCASVYMIQGQYYPIRSVMGNYQGPSSLNFTIQAPGGSPTNDFTGNTYPSTCVLYA